MTASDGAASGGAAPGGPPPVRKPVHVLNGANLGMLGTRQPEVYGTGTLADLGGACAATAAELGVELVFRQTDDEATLLGWLHEAATSAGAVVLNPGAWTHYSYAVRDAAAIVTDAGVPLIEVHLSNPGAREPFRHTDVIVGVATGLIAGFGVQSYRLALQAAADMLR